MANCVQAEDVGRVIGNLYLQLKFAGKEQILGRHRVITRRKRIKSLSAGHYDRPCRRVAAVELLLFAVQNKLRELAPASSSCRPVSELGQLDRRVCVQLGEQCA